MNVFRRSKTDPVADFWQWWTTAGIAIAAAIPVGTVEALAGDIAGHVNAIDAGLEWELSKGTTAEHALIVTAAGNPKLRAAAARWLAQAPAADATWQYHDSRPADPAVFTARIGIAGVDLALADMRYAFIADEEAGRVDVICYHPGFASLPDGARAQVSFLSLDWLLGERAVEVWIGSVEWIAEDRADLQVPSALSDMVATIVERWTDEHWTLLSGQDGATPVIALAQRPLRSARWPRFGSHVAVNLPYLTANEGRLPVAASLDALRAFEDDVSERVGGDGVLVAHETSRGQRTLHYYVDSQSDAQSRIRTALPSWSEGKASVTVRDDPGFDHVAHLAG